MNDLEAYGEIQAMYLAADEQKQQKLVSYLTYCAERLKEGGSVQEIWKGWLEREQAEQIITISEHIPIEVFAPATVIAKVFRDRKMVYIPSGADSYGFLRMISAIWYGGYMAGVRAERRKRRSH